MGNTTRTRPSVRAFGCLCFAACAFGGGERRRTGVTELKIRIIERRKGRAHTPWWASARQPWPSWSELQPPSPSCASTPVPCPPRRQAAEAGCVGAAGAQQTQLTPACTHKPQLYGTSDCRMQHHLVCVSAFAIAAAGSKQLTVSTFPTVPASPAAACAPPAFHGGCRSSAACRSPVIHHETSGPPASGTLGLTTDATNPDGRGVDTRCILGRSRRSSPV